MDASFESLLIALIAIIAALGIHALSKRHRQRRVEGINIYHLTPIQFEHHCAHVLESNGWKCKTTRASGDYGIDLVAEAQGHRVVFQIKKWSKPVNLSAVQEAVAGIAIYRAKSACVISVSGYQRSAINLAAANKVRHMSYHELRGFTPPASQGFLSRLRQKSQQSRA